MSVHKVLKIDIDFNIRIYPDEYGLINTEKHRVDTEWRKCNFRD